MQPLIYSAQAALDGVGWRRGGREVTYFENGVTRRDREKGSHSTMSFVWTCEHDSDLLYFAMCYPYTFSKLRRCGAPPRAREYGSPVPGSWAESARVAAGSATATSPRWAPTRRAGGTSGASGCAPLPEAAAEELRRLAPGRTGSTRDVF